MTSAAKTHQRWRSVLTVACAVTAGCAAPEQAQIGQQSESVGEQAQALTTTNTLTTNSLWNNGLWSNRLWSNRLWSNRLWSNGLFSNRLWSNGVFSNRLWSNGLWSSAFWRDSGMADTLSSNPHARQLLQYVYECAMPGADANGVSYDTTLDPSDGGIPCGPSGSCDPFYTCSSENKCVIPLKGGVGLAINTDVDPPTAWWEPGQECREACQRWISACVLARTNAYGVPVTLSLRPPANAPLRIRQALLGEALTLSEEEQEFTAREGAFYGNIFQVRPEVDRPAVEGDPTYGGETGLPEPGPVQSIPNYYACAGPASNIPDITKRFCSSQGAGTVIDVPGVCLPTTLQQEGVCLGEDEETGALQDCRACGVADEQFNPNGRLINCRPEDGHPDYKLYSEVLTVFLEEPIERCGNGVCEAQEEAAVRDPAVPESAKCRNDCRLGTWGKVWNARLSAAAVDQRDGAVIVAGTMGNSERSIDFGGGELLQVPGRLNDIVIGKFTADGAFVWGKRLSNDENLQTVTVAAIAPDGTIALGGTTELPGSRTAWIAKFDGGTDALEGITPTHGELLAGWPIFFGPVEPSPGSPFAGAITEFNKLVIDDSGSLIGAGTFEDEVEIGGLALDRSVAVFAFKMAATGASVAWARDLPGNNAFAQGLSVDPSGNVLLTLATGTSSVIHKLQSATGLGAAGLWPKTFNTLQVNAGGVAVDGDGAVYITGSGTPYNFSAGAPLPTTPGAVSEFFLVKYDADGNYGWDVGEAESTDAETAANEGAARSYSSGRWLSFDGAGNVVVGGQFGASVGPGSVDLGTGLLNSWGSDDFFVTSYSPGSGQLRWVKHVPMILGGLFFGAYSGRETDGTGRIYTAGQFAGSMLVDDRILISDIPEDDFHFQTFLSSFVIPGEDRAPCSTPGTCPPPVVDNTPPIMDDVPQSMVLEAEGPNGNAVWYMPPTAIDDGNAGATVSCLPAPESVFPVDQTTPVRCTAYDPFGNRGTDARGPGGTLVPAEFTVTIRDRQPPFISDVKNVTAPATSPLGATVAFTPPTATDIVDGPVSVSCNHAPGEFFPMGVTTVTCSASDTRQNMSTGTFDIIVLDTLPPIFPDPPPQVASAIGPWGADVEYALPTAIDNIDGLVAPVCIPPSGSIFPLGTTMVTCIATDAAGNSTPRDFSVTVRDTDAPVPTVPTDITREATDSGGGVVDYVASATDAVDGPVTPICNPPSGSLFPIGTTSVMCIATDAAGNAAQAEFNVTITKSKPPEIVPPAPVVVEATSASGAVVSYTVTASDTVDGSVPVSCDRPSGNVFPLGTTIVTCSAVDSAGNRATESFSVVVRDTTPPALTLPGNVTVVPASTAGANVNYAATAVDLVDGVVVPNCLPRAGLFTPGTTTVQCTATDASGNSVGGSFTVQVQYSWSGVLHPLKAGGSAVFKRGHLIPVRFKLTGASAGITNLTARLFIAPVTATGVGPYVEAQRFLNFLPGNAFLYSHLLREYVFGLPTWEMAPGTYSLLIDMGDGAQRTVQFKVVR